MSASSHILGGIYFTCLRRYVKKFTQKAYELQKKKQPKPKPNPANPARSTFAWPRFPAGQLFCFLQPIFAIPVAPHRKKELVHSKQLNIFLPPGSPEPGWLAPILDPTGSVMGLCTCMNFLVLV